MQYMEYFFTRIFSEKEVLLLNVLIFVFTCYVHLIQSI